MRKIKLNRILGGGSIGILSVLVFVLLSCPNLGAANAQETPATDATSAAAKIYAKSTISISPLQEFNLAITPESSGATFANGKVEVSITTNNRSGYGLYLHTTSAEGKLRNRDSGVADTINPMENPANPMSATFANNTWGYSKNGMDYQAVPTSSTEIIKTDVASTNTKHEVYIGAKIDTNLAAGEYRGDVVLSAVANPVTVATLADLVYMQEITPTICKNTEEYDKTFVVKDKRDQKDYKIAKLRDNNCWMQENLALNLGFEMTSETTDLAPGKKVTLPATTAASSTSNDNNGSSSFHPNSYWYYQWRAATADSGTLAAITTAEQEAPDSICPRGWQMPLAGTKYNTITKSGNPDKQLGSGSFYDLFVSYGVTNYSTMASIGMAMPLNFYLSGHLYFGTTAGNNVGVDGYYWTRVACANTSAHNLTWGSAGGFSPSSGNERYHGFTVRCVARQVAR